MELKTLLNCIGFDWDKGNFKKSWLKHKVNPFESEQIFFNEPLIIIEDSKHSNSETRYYALGRTNGERCLFIVFTIRKDKIRIISARDMNKKEKKAYGS